MKTIAACGAVVVLASMIGVPAPIARAAADAPPVSVAVAGNHLVDGAGQTIRLLGVDRSGTEYACEQGWGIFDGPSDSTSVAAMAGWHINAVRIPLNEGCWLDEYTSANDPYATAGNPAPYEGAAYQSAVGAYVALLHSYGIAAIVELGALDAPDGLDVPPMADSQYSPTFWSSVASYFKSDPGVLFDLYNEPHSISWSCWKSGCPVSTSGGSYQAAGMQQLVDSVRSTGANQPIMLGGLDYSSDETSWLASEPTDPDGSLVVSFHTYNSTNCNTATCWNNTVAPLAAVVPVVTGEIGEYDCATSYTDAYMQFADSEGISYLGWAWDAIAPGGWQCSSPALITNYDGSPSPEGVALQSHLLALFDASGHAPAITTLSPSSGPGAAGTKVKITGTGFKGASAVEFGSSAATSYKVNSAGTSITAYAPAELAGTVRVSVTTAGGTSAAVAADEFTYLAPTVTKVSPSSGVGGTKVKITGAAFNGASAVEFGSSAATSYKVNSAGTSITAYAPAELAGTVRVSVTTAGGTSAAVAADEFTYLAPTVTKLSPSSGVGGTKVKITGADLAGVSAVEFGSTAATSYTVSSSGTSITAYAPPGAPGTVNVSVTTPAGTSTFVPFTYL